MNQAYFLRIGNDTLDDAERHATKASAVASFRRCAEGLDRYGQAIDASLHIAESRNAVAESPDFVLSLGPRGGIRVEAC